jgi:mxaJ protein
MSSACKGSTIAWVGRLALIVSALCATAVGPPALASTERAALRVCADPNNMPFSNRSGEGFENKIAELVARDTGRTVSYYWWPQRRGFLRNTLAANRCDVVMGVPASAERPRPTRPYYRSSYAFVSRHDRHLNIHSFDDDRLRTLAIGIQLTGDDYANPPAAQALASRHIVQNVHGFTVYGDYAKPDPQRSVIDAVAGGQVDLAVVWGPLAGFFTRKQTIAMDVVPVSAERADRSMPFVFDIAMGVRPDDRALRAELDAVIARRRAAIRRILLMFGVPLL